jgi:hypothetical protein
MLGWIGFGLVQGIKNKFNIFNVHVGSVRKVIFCTLDFSFSTVPKLRLGLRSA